VCTAVAVSHAKASCECENKADCDCNVISEHGGGHKALFPLDDYDKMGFALIGLMTAIAAGGGIGGGGVLVPILILVMGFSIKAAIPLSACTIFGGSVFHIMRNISRRHPTADRLLIDWNFIALMQPLLIAGAVIGSFLNKVIPDYILAITLFMILIVTARKTFQNAMKKWAKEAAALNESGEETLLEPVGGQAGASPLLEDGNGGSSELDSLLEEDRKFPYFKVTLILLCFVGVCALNISKGSEAAGFTPFNIKCGSTMFWVLSLLVVPWCLMIGYIMRNILVSQYHARVASNWDFHDGDVRWDEEKTVMYPMISTLAGIIAGMFGIGGGLINGPLMVELGFVPDVAAASGATMLLFTSTTSTIMYVLFDILNFEYAYYLVPLGFSCTLFGQLVFNRIMHHYKRDSLIIFVIAFIVFMSAILMGIEGAYVGMETLKKGDLFKVAGICGAVPLTKEFTIEPHTHG
jgi:uncharacterized membrane protein YfcA